ncbi:hypothetical protein RGR602_CH03146 [Rhizobium gallicum bv. gallicum R602sp]|uniref:Uncharacterized protein n=1 Tax=Rhizobium gallicum bv. gallicum R602sp TaxID=1041138 RepID=A0A0B4X7C4_9HYPH|nr:hypothetical protein RGR602_CH03146 [Rhizobium gallicum bv. gallicum R602sp]
MSSSDIPGGTHIGGERVGWRQCAGPNFTHGMTSATHPLTDCFVSCVYPFMLPFDPYLTSHTDRAAEFAAFQNFSAVMAFFCKLKTACIATSRT